MADIITINQVADVIISLRGENVILASDVAKLYGVETRRINEAVKNNPDKFPEGFVITLSVEEKEKVVENFDHLRKLKYSPTLPTVFTERGLYMLATILKSPIATQTTLAIVNTFAQVREVRREISSIHNTETPIDKDSQIKFMSKVGGLITEILMPELQTSETESSMELNLFIGKLKHTVKRTRKVETKEKLLELSKRLMDKGLSETEIIELLEVLK